MEFLLLWIDELDDLVGVVRHIAPKLLALLWALLSFLMTVLAFTLAPQVMLGTMGLLLVIPSIEAVRRRLWVRPAPHPYP